MKRWPWLVVLFAVLAVGAAYAKERPVPKKVKDVSVEIQMEKDPPEVGENRIEVIVTDENGKVVKDAKVIVDAFMPSLPGMPLETNMVEAKLDGGKYRAKIVLPRSGSWDMSVRVIQGGKTTLAKWTVSAR